MAFASSIANPTGLGISTLAHKSTITRPTITTISDSKASTASSVKVSTDGRVTGQPKADSIEGSLGAGAI